MCNAVDTFRQNIEGGCYQLNPTLTAASQEILPRDLSRIALVLGAPNGAIVWYSFQGPAAIGTGILIPNQGNSITLSLAEHGSIVQEAVHAILSAGSAPVTVLVSTRMGQVKPMRNAG